MPVGLKRGAVAIEMYDKSWRRAFEVERILLQSVFGDVPIEHVGSTAVPGLPAKPLIDIAVGVPATFQLDTVKEKLINLGYEYMPQRISSDDAFFPKGPREKRTHHVHIVPFEGKEWHNMLGFRDYLRAHSEVARKYAALKRQLAKEYPNDRQKYTKAKSEFIKSIIL